MSIIKIITRLYRREKGDIRERRGTEEGGGGQKRFYNRETITFIRF